MMYTRFYDKRLRRSGLLLYFQKFSLHVIWGNSLFLEVPSKLSVEFIYQFCLEYCIYNEENYLARKREFGQVWSFITKIIWIMKRTNHFLEKQNFLLRWRRFEKEIALTTFSFKLNITGDLTNLGNSPFKFHVLDKIMVVGSQNTQYTN